MSCAASLLSDTDITVLVDYIDALGDNPDP